MGSDGDILKFPLMGDAPEIIPASILNPGAPQRPSVSDNDAVQLRRILIHLGLRDMEALNLYRPMPHQERFHASKALERIARGSNRSGKTLSAAVEVARAVTGQDPHDKYPLRDGIWYCVAKSGKEVGGVLYRLLFKPGAFRIIRDKVTNKWRTFYPNDPQDEERRKESRPSPPLIPRRMVKSEAWESKKESIPKMITLTTGWELHFFTSNGKPPHGTAIDGALFDEEIVHDDWYPEIAARLVDKMGRFLWSATPQAGTHQLWQLHLRSMEDEGNDPRQIEEFLYLLDENIHQTDQQRRMFAAKLTDEERAVRVGGEFALMGRRIYPEFTQSLHGVEPFEVPSDWSWYMVVDPGVQVCAVLFLVVPPESKPEEPNAPGAGLPAALFGDYLYVVGELYLKQCDADKFGDAVEKWMPGKRFIKFIIDGQEARKANAGDGKTTEAFYIDALTKRKISSEVTGSGFEWGSPTPYPGIQAVKMLLKQRDGKPPVLRVFIVTDPDTGKVVNVPNLMNEIQRYQWKVVDGITTDTPVKKNDHLLDCLRYAAQAEFVYVPPGVRPRASSEIAKLLASLKGDDQQTFMYLG